MNILQMMASSLELMETDESFARKLSEIVERRVNALNGDDEKEVTVAQAVNGEDNVVHLSFVKAVGNA